MPEWKVIYLNKFEKFYDQDNIPELTVPEGTSVHWLHGDGYPRPEMDAKTRPQSEVYEGDKSANGFYMHSKGRFGIVTFPITVIPGKSLRASVMYMHVFNKAPTIGGGSRLGIDLGGAGSPFVLGGPAWPVDGTSPFESKNIVWSEWQGTYGPEALPNREWAPLVVPEVLITPIVSSVRLIILFTADVAGEGSHGHWDNLVLEQYDAGIVTPPPTGGSSFDAIRGHLNAALDGLNEIESHAVKAIVIG